jgi:hypothetical protein
MASDVPRLDKNEIASDILVYLTDHPDAQDTLEGIAEWWILERKTTHQLAQVKDAVQKLVQKGYLEEKIMDIASGRKHYRAAIFKKNE